MSKASDILNSQNESDQNSYNDFELEVKVLVDLGTSNLEEAKKKAQAATKFILESCKQMDSVGVYGRIEEGSIVDGEGNEVSRWE